MEEFDWLNLDFDEAIQYTDEILFEPSDNPVDMAVPDDDWIFGDMLTSSHVENNDINTNNNHNNKTKVKKTEPQHKVMDRAKINRSTVHKVSWSVKNRAKGKTYKEYIGRQLKIGRRICGHIVNLFNNQDLDLFFDFIDKYYAKDCLYHDMTKGPHPHTGEMNVDRKTQGVDVMKNMLKHSFKNNS